MKTAFPPIATPQSKILILGSMPGEVSLHKRQYYAHPRNAFWWIMGELFSIQPSLPYLRRMQQLVNSGIGLWDVLHRCKRKGSLDSAIEPDSVEANDFRVFLDQHPSIQAIFFNGKSVESLFRRHVIRDLGYQPAIPLLTLPSTSPANARLRPEDKLKLWRQLQDYL